MNRFLHIALLPLLALSLALAGCDSDEEAPDSERIVGTWDVETVNATTSIGLSVPVFQVDAAGDEAAFSFQADGTYTFTFDPAEGRELTLTVADRVISIPLTATVDFSGTYTLSEADDTLRFTEASIPGGFTLGYRFRSDDALELSAEDPETLALLLGLAGEDLELLASVVTGGSFSLDKN